LRQRLPETGERSSGESISAPDEAEKAGQYGHSRLCELTYDSKYIIEQASGKPQAA